MTITEERLAEIEARAAWVLTNRTSRECHHLAEDADDLLAEVRRLNAELAELEATFNKLWEMTIDDGESEPEAKP